VNANGDDWRALNSEGTSCRYGTRKTWRRGEIEGVVEREATVGERWYVSCFQHGCMIRRDRQCLCGFRGTSNRAKLVARLVARKTAHGAGPWDGFVVPVPTSPAQVPLYDRETQKKSARAGRVLRNATCLQILREKTRPLETHFMLGPLRRFSERGNRGCQPGNHE
jgi:hypothetical protein